jgi:hypothetical protein
VVGAELLVCDRTFASLDSVASRLLGQWAGYGLRYLVNWKTDVVSDYLSCSCPKIVLQDPNDEIIANAASLKNGVSTHLILGDNLWSINTYPNEYILADFMNDPLPNMNNSNEYLKKAEDLNIPLTETFIIHLSACIMSISKQAYKMKLNSKKIQKNVNKVNRNINSNDHNGIEGNKNENLYGSNSIDER